MRRSLNNRGYEYSRHIAPHDIKVRELGNFGKSRLDSALELGIEFDIAPKLSIEDGIEAVRKALPNCWFDKSKCQKAIEYLKAYQKKWDEKINVLKTNPCTILHHIVLMLLELELLVMGLILQTGKKKYQ